MRGPISHVYLVVYGKVSPAESAVAIDAEPEEHLSRISVEKDNDAIPSNPALAAQSDEEATALFESDISRALQFSSAETGTSSASHSSVTRYGEFERDMDRALQLSLAETGTSAASHSSVSRCGESASFPAQTETNNTSQPAFENVADILPVDFTKISNLGDVNKDEESEADSNVSSSHNPATCSGHQTSFTALSLQLLQSTLPEAPIFQKTTKTKKTKPATMSLMLVLLLEKENPRKRLPLEMAAKATSKLRLPTSPVPSAYLVVPTERKRRRQTPPQLLAPIALLHERIKRKMLLAIKRRVAVIAVAA